MAEFVYQGYRSPYAASMAELIARQGDPYARAAEQTGNAYARAAEMQGAAWNNAANTIGQSVAAIPQQMQAQTHAAQTNELNAITLQRAREEEKSRVVFEAALKDPSNRNPDGTINSDAITKTLQSQNVGAWQQWNTISAANQRNAMDLMAKGTEIMKAQLDTEQKRRQMQEAQGEYLGKLAFNAEQLLSQKPDDPIHARDTALASVARAAADGAVGEQDAKAFLMQTASATPAQLKQAFGTFVPPELRAKLEKEAADTAKARADAAKAGAETTNLQRFGRTTPGTPEEQYLTAVQRGDTATAQQILGTIQATAAAHRDPNQTALVETLRGLNVQQAQERLQKLREENAPLDVSNSVFTTSSGNKYIDLSEFQTPQEREKARKAADAAGVMPVAKEVADGLRAADTARANFKGLFAQLSPYLPKDASGRLVGGPKNTLDKVFQSNPVLGAFGSWRTAAIQAVQALAEKGMGLRLNRAEIDLMLQNDIPQITDDAPTAKQRLDNMMTLLDNKERNALSRDRSAPTAKVGDIKYLADGSKVQITFIDPKGNATVKKVQ